MAFACLIVSLRLMAEQPAAGPAAPGPQPPYQIVRSDEDWSYLQDPSKRSDYLDPLKYIPLNRSRPDFYLSLGGETRQSYENIHNDYWSAAPFSVYSFELQRYQLHADLHLGSRFRTFLQLQSGLEENRGGGPRPIDEKHLDFLGAFVDFKIRTGPKPIVVRAGRDELNFGAGRLVAVREGPNVRQGFYDARIIANLGRWRLDGFAARPAQDNPGYFDNAPDHATQFWGVYATGPLPAGERSSLDLYYLGIDNKSATFNQGTARELRHSLGARLATPPTQGDTSKLDYDMEAVYQFGTFGEGNIRAWTLASETGYSFRQTPLRPRISLRADISSGDDNPKKKDLQTFNALFPIGNYFGVFADTGPGPDNFRDLHPRLESQLTGQLSLSLDWVLYWRQSLNDGVYAVPGFLIRPADGSRERFVGHRPGVEAHWQIDRHSFLQLDYGIFYAGPFLRETGGDKNLGYFSLWAGYKF